MSALDLYLEQIEPWAGLDLGVDLDAISAGNDRAAIGYALAATEAAWQALPANLRAKAIDALRELGAQLVSQVIGIGEVPLTTLGQTISESLGEASEGAGPIVEFIVAVVAGVVKIVQVSRDIRRDRSSADRYWARVRALGNRPTESYVWHDIECPGFPAYTGPGSPLNRWAAAITPDRGETEYFFGRKVPPVVGKWRTSNGVALNCDIGGGDLDDRWMGCDVTGNFKDRFRGYVNLNALSFPYWSPSYPSRPMPLNELDLGPYGVVLRDPNASIMRAQLLAFVSPHDNFSISERAVLGAVQHMRARWIGEIKNSAYLGRFADLDRKEAADFSWRYTPDLERDPGHVPSATSKRFYFDPSGTISIYPGYQGEGIDLAAYGINPDPLADGERGLGMSIADYNAVISSARSLLTARAAYLRSPTTCQAVIIDREQLAGEPLESAYGSELAAAIRAGASARAGAATRVRAPSTSGAGAAANGGFAPGGGSPSIGGGLPPPPPIGSAQPIDRLWRPLMIAAGVSAALTATVIAVGLTAKPRPRPRRRRR